MSKSRGNIQDPRPIVRVLGIDALRYFLLREMVFGQDGNFSLEALVQRYNSDLANGLGNLASRVLAMIQQYFGGEIPASQTAALTHRESAIAGIGSASIEECRILYDRFQFSGVLQSLWDLVAEVDKYLVVRQPWILAADPEHRETLGSVLHTAAEALRVVAVLSHPVLPHATQKIWEQLGLSGEVADQWIDELQWGQLPPGTKIGTPEAIFPRVEKEEALERIEAMEHEMQGQPAAGKGASAATPGKISIEDFSKVEMCAGEVKAAERVAGADKLLKLMVDIGDEVRQVVAGIAEVYKPEDLVGRKVIVVSNLAPRRLRGVESNGMVLAAVVGPQGKPVLATFTEEVAPGARLK
jgi:methionyl-tRNA synthetase